jgi:hypothetical protein
MTGSSAYAVFERLCEQIEKMREVAAAQEAEGNLDVASLMRRACIVLTVAALDSYMHERGVELLVARAKEGAQASTQAAAYLGLTASQVTSTEAEGYVRYRLSYKTLAAPSKVDDLLTATGRTPADIWLDVAIKAGSRPERIRRQTELQYDRRNQIAHEADWDPVGLEFRLVNDTHVGDCVDHVRSLVEQMDTRL